MALEVEDGTGKANADSYASVAEADAYLTARGVTIWNTASETNKEEALRRATDYMSDYNWKGWRKTATQLLDWPREGVVANNFRLEDNVVPVKVKYACIELALRAGSGPLYRDIQADDSGRLATKVVERVGPLSSEVTYPVRGYFSARVKNVYPIVDNYVSEYVADVSYVYR